MCVFAISTHENTNDFIFRTTCNRHVTEFKNKACSHISKHQCSVRTVKLVQIIDNIRVRPRYKNSILVYLEKDQTSIKLYLYREMAA